MSELETKKVSQSLPMLALRGLAVFPGMILHFDVGRKKSMKAISAAMKGDQLIFLCAQRDVREDDPGKDDLFTIGTVAKVKQIVQMPGENMRVLIDGLFRAETVNIESDEPFFTAEVEPCVQTGKNLSKLRTAAYIKKLEEMIDRFSELGPKLPADIFTEMMASKDAGALADFIASNVMTEFEDKQLILEELNPEKRIKKVITLLDREIGILEIEQDISEKVHQEIDKSQRDYYLHEQMKVLSEELGEDDNPQSEAEEYSEKIAKLHLGESGSKDKIKNEKEALEKMNEQVNRLARMPFGSHEATVVRTWLDSCLALPWKKETKDKIDLQNARKILDRDHYGLDKVKDRIIEYLAVRKLSPDVKGQIICLVGPPGVGKTSIARSIARATGKKYVRVSLGGVRDEADIRGHRKTYIGAMPGRIMNAIADAGSKNPLLLLDEVDKLEGDFRGDPASALLEVLDSEQNFAFRDHFIEIPFDLSDVMFITTANTTESIPEPLLDRMEVIELSSYTREEKFNIAKQHLVSKQLKKHGMNKQMLRIEDDTLYSLIDNYTCEAGVRNLERKIGSLCRKSAKEIVDGKKRVIIKAEDLEKLLGPKRFKPETISDTDEVGTVTGLAWTAVGGVTMKIETAVMEGTGKIELTGSLGDVMKESAKAAISYIRTRADDFNIDSKFYKTKDIHIHAPEGAVPKDGPSAGVTMATALLSALTGNPVRRDVAMTGEISLLGKVMPIGGLKEKTMAAYRAGVKTVIIPKDNEPDLAEVDKTVKENVKFITATNLDTVFKNAIICPKDTQNKKESETKEDKKIFSGVPGNKQMPAIRQ